MIEHEVEALAALAAKLRPLREDTPLANDMFEAAADWANFGQMQIEKPEEENWDLTGRMQQEEELLASLEDYYGKQMYGNPDYARVMEIGASLIAACKQRKIHPDGWKGILRILRDTFAFLTSEFGMRPGSGTEGVFEYASERVEVSFRLPNHHDSCCRLTRASDPSRRFELEDLLFMDGVSASLALPPGQEFTTEADVQAWFTTVADILRRHGSDVLADRPGAFERLAQASAERERLHVEECERLWSLANPGKPVPKFVDGVWIDDPGS